MTRLTPRSIASTLALAGVLVAGGAATALASTISAGHRQLASADGERGSAGAPQRRVSESKRREGAGSRAAAKRKGKRPKSRAPRVVAAPAALRATTPRSASALASDLGTLLGSGTRDGRWGIMVVSLTRGDTLYSLNAGESMLPASTMKLMTTALAFDQFGPQHQLTTTVLREGSVRADGTLNGNLVIRGGGDPGITWRFFKGGPSAALQSLAQQVAASGIKRVQGDVIGDASAFDDKRIPDGWLARYLGAGYAARVSPLAVNENLGIVRITPGDRGAVVALDPPSSAIPVVGTVKQTKGSGARVSVRKRSDGAVTVSGWIGSRSPSVAYQIVLDDPARYVTGAFRDALVAQGITVHGQVRMARAAPSAVTVGTLRSQPLSHLAALMNRESINHFAELLFRDVAHAASPDRIGSAQAGNALLRRFMAAKVGADSSAVYAADGSGLSTLDRITARSMVQLLAYAHRAPWSTDFHASLPVAGESELLRHRMKFTAAQGNLHAKTGTTNDVIGLAGYVTAADGELIAFSFLYNGRDRWNAKSAIDASGVTLASFARD